MKDEGIKRNDLRSILGGVVENNLGKEECVQVFAQRTHNSSTSGLSRPSVWPPTFKLTALSPDPLAPRI